MPPPTIQQQPNILNINYLRAPTRYLVKAGENLHSDDYPTCQSRIQALYLTGQIATKRYDEKTTHLSLLKQLLQHNTSITTLYQQAYPKWSPGEPKEMSLQQQQQLQQATKRAQPHFDAIVATIQEIEKSPTIEYLQLKYETQLLFAPNLFHAYNPFTSSNNNQSQPLTFTNLSYMNDSVLQRLSDNVKTINKYVSLPDKDIHNLSRKMYHTTTTQQQKDKLINYYKAVIDRNTSSSLNPKTRQQLSFQPSQIKNHLNLQQTEWRLLRQLDQSTFSNAFNALGRINPATLLYTYTNYNSSNAIPTTYINIAKALYNTKTPTPQQMRTAFYFALIYTAARHYYEITTTFINTTTLYDFVPHHDATLIKYYQQSIKDITKRLEKTTITIQNLEFDLMLSNQRLNSATNRLTHFKSMVPSTPIQNTTPTPITNQTVKPASLDIKPSTPSTDITIETFRYQNLNPKLKRVYDFFKSPDMKL